MANKFRLHLHEILTGRLTYFLGRAFTTDVLRQMRMEESEDKKQMRFWYGGECLLHVDLSIPMCARIAAWDRITLDEIKGTASGPGAFQKEHAHLLEKYMQAFAVPAVYLKPGSTPENN